MARACIFAGRSAQRSAWSELNGAVTATSSRSARAVLDPLEAPMPPKVTVEQAVHFAELLIRGERDRGTIARNALDERLRELV